MLVVVTVPASAHGYFAGGGKDAAKGNDCLIGYEGIDAVDVTVDGKKQVVTCTDCDPTCDHDGESTANGSCMLQVGACINQSGVEGCTAPSALDKARAKGKVNGVRVPADDLRIIAPPLDGSVCWPYVDVAVRIKKKRGEGSATLKLSALVKRNEAEGITKTRRDKDTLTYVCVPNPAGEACPVSTTTSTTATSTTTTGTTLQSGCFQDWGDGTIRDTCTNLQWEKKDGSDGTPNAANLHDVDNPYSWAGCCNGDCWTDANLCQPNPAAAATCMALSDGGTAGCSTCASGTCEMTIGTITTVWDWLNQVNAENFAGQCDWRLPTAFMELGTIVDLAAAGCHHDSPCIDPIFGPTWWWNYWSSTTIAPAPGFAYTVNFFNGLVYPNNKYVGVFVRAVRDVGPEGEHRIARESRRTSAVRVP